MDNESWEIMAIKHINRLSISGCHRRDNIGLNVRGKDGKKTKPMIPHCTPATMTTAHAGKVLKQLGMPSGMQNGTDTLVSLQTYIYTLLIYVAYITYK